MRQSIRFAFALIAAPIGCGDAAPDYAGFEHRVATLTEELRIDGQREDLVRIGALAVNRHGIIAFNQAQDGQIRIHAPSGELIGRFGRKGAGPREFQNPYRLGWHGDTLWVIDGALRRITFVTSSLEMVREVPNIASTARPAPADSGRFPEFPFAYAQAVGADGALYALFGRAANQVLPEPFTDRSPIGRMREDGTIEDVVVLLPPPQGGGVTTPQGSTASLPFGNSAEFAIAPHAGRIAVAMAAIEGTDAGTFSLTVTDMRGDTLTARRYRFEPEPIPEAVGDSTIAATLQRLEPFPDLAAAAKREARVPPVYPPFTGLVIGNDGSIWIENRGRDEGRPYYVVAAGGDAIGTVHVPPGGRIGAATLDTIWVIEPDELGVPSVVRYAVQW